MPRSRLASSSQALTDLQALADTARAASHRRYFKTGKGEYGEGDTFLGITVPQARTLAKKHRALPLDEVIKLLSHKVHEARLLALLILVDQFKRGDKPTRKGIYDAYLANRMFINNWDLIDTSARDIVGAYLAERSHRPLFELARSGNWCDRRIAIIATMHFIGSGQFDTTLSLAVQLLNDKHDLMHKAVGWMLRELGSKDVKPLQRFLEQHAHHMPRTMLRYAVEKLQEQERRDYMGRRAVAISKA